MHMKKTCLHIKVKKKDKEDVVYCYFLHNLKNLHFLSTNTDLGNHLRKFKVAYDSVVTCTSTSPFSK